jgi:hypothetical protein
MRFLFCLLLGFACTSAHAGLYYSGEQPAELPARWRGFLLDIRTLRMISGSAAQPTFFRQQYLAAVAKLDKTAKDRNLTPDEQADLGALYVRLGEPVKAIEVLRAAFRQNPEHFRIAANLGTAWQMQGDLTEATRALQESARLAPAQWKPFEEAHHKLVRFRQQQRKNTQSLDDLFGVKYVGESGKVEAGKLARAERKLLPDNDIAVVQQLLLWLPADGRLLWQLGELANAHHDVRTAASILDGCVNDYAMGSAELRQRRQIYRDAADAIAKLPDEEHAKYRGDIVFKSPRALLRKVDISMLPPIREKGVNTLSWLVIAETTVDRHLKPTFHKYLDQLDGKQVAMTGFMYTGANETELGSFMFVEFPIGCWFCETPEITSIVFVQMPTGKTTPLKRGLVKVQGKLKLNRTDPEAYLYAIEDAAVGEVD